MSGEVTIYALCDPDGAVRYIGQTSWSVAARLREHWERCTWEHSRKALWLRSLREGGQYPLAHALESVDAGSADEAEQRQIAAHRAAGCALTNARAGGRGAGANGRTGFWLTHEERGQLARLARRENRSVQGQIHQFIAEALAARAAPMPAAPALTQEDHDTSTTPRLKPEACARDGRSPVLRRQHNRPVDSGG